MTNKLIALKPVFLLLGIVCAYSFTHAQVKYQAAKVIPPSPTAASLGKYGEVPIGYYTGSANITIPLYEIKTAGHTLPVTLSYASTGVKVGETASWVGLGWALSAGGVITKTTLGLDDFGNNGYYMAPPLPPSQGSEYYPSGNFPADKQYFDNIYNGYLDGEPDIFHYNFAGRAGKFAVGKNSDGSVVYMDERNNMKVQYIPATISWLITDGNGYKYYFNTRESATEYNYSSTSFPISDNAPLSAFTRVIQADVTTAWYLDSIVAPTAEAIKFTYEVKSHSISNISKSEKAFDMLQLTGSCTNTPASTFKFYAANRQVVYDVYLKRINFDQGSVEFNTTDRDDIEYTDAIKPAKLSEIIIRDLGNKVIKRYTFSHSYFNASSDKRLKLDSLFEYGSDGVAKPPHVFSYFSPNGIAPRYSNSVDFWGYPNNNSSMTMVPAVTVPEYSRVFTGANRDPDTTVARIRSGMLSSITYPTGGRTDFDYEMNRYAHLTGNDGFTQMTDSRQIYAYDGDTFSHLKAEFDIVDTPSVRLLFNFVKTDPNGSNLFNPNIETIYAYLYKNGQIIKTYSSWFSSNSFDENESDEAFVVVGPGHYKIQVNYIQGYLTTMSASWDYKVPVKEKRGGGLRIKSVINYENGKQAYIKNLFYTAAPDSSSGRLITRPTNSYILQYDARTDGSGGEAFGCPYHVAFLARESGSVYPLGLASGGAVVGYDKVTESLGENGEGGKTEYYYNNIEDYNDGTPFLPAVHDPRNGKLRRTIVYDANDVKLKRTEYVNLAKETYSLKGVKLYRIDQVATPQPSDIVAELVYKLRFYDQVSNWFPLQSETTTEYSGSDSIVISKTYDYQNFDNKEVTSMEVTRSDGRKITTRYKYPGDYTTAGTASFVTKMKELHMISPRIEEQSFITTGTVQKLVAGSFTEYKPYNGCYLPGTIYKINTDVPLSDITATTISADNQIHLHPNYKPDVYLDRYNTAGNVEQYHGTDNSLHVYIWDYKNGSPIAQVDNAGFTDVACTSFEADGAGNWAIGSASRNTTAAITGRRSFNMADAGATGITKTALTASRSYTVSYWTKNAAAYTITGTQGQVLKGKTINGWTYYQHKVSGQTTIKLSGSGLIDELRLYPADAKMISYTYDPLVGATATCDDKNQVTYYEYDAMGRLKLLRDQDGRIIKQNDYQYQQAL